MLGPLRGVEGPQSGEPDMRDESGGQVVKSCDKSLNFILFANGKHQRLFKREAVCLLTSPIWKDHLDYSSIEVMGCRGRTVT